MLHKDSFALTGPTRQVNDDQVANLDRALATAAGMPVKRVLHAIDPRRLLTFQNGGPPVWSVGLCPCANGDFIYVTYGLSQFIDPSAAFSHEMSMRAPADASGQPAQWPTLLLRQLARYQIGSGRELKAGDPMVFGESISRAAMARAHKGAMPDSAMRAVGIVADPVMPSVRRVYGLYSDEQALAEPWSTSGLLSEIARMDPRLTTDLGRASWASDTSLQEAARLGTERDGSETGAMVVPGIRWSQTKEGIEVHIPGGLIVQRVAAMVNGRLGFGRTLMMHDYEPGPRSEVGLTPSGEVFARTHGDGMLELGLPPQSPLLHPLFLSACVRQPAPVTLFFRSS